MTQYDQTKEDFTKYSCTIYSMLNMIKYDFWVSLKDSYIYSIVYYMEKIWALLPRWAYFGIIYPAMVKLIEIQTWLKLKIKIWYISSWLDNISMWGLWAKRLSSLSISLSKDWFLSVEDMKTIADSEKWSWHNHVVKLKHNNNEWIILDSRGGLVYWTSLEALKKWVDLWIYYDKARALIPADEKTRKVKEYCIKYVRETWRFISWERFKKLDFSDF